MRRMIFGVMTALLLLGSAGCAQAQPADSPQRTPAEATAGFFAMDTYIDLTAYGAGAEAALEAAQARIQELEGLWSVTDPGSDIYAVNHSGGVPTQVHADTAQVLSFALDMAGETGGALDPTLYPVLTAWGFTTDQYQIPDADTLSALLANTGYEKVSLNGQTMELPSGMELDLGAVGKGYAADETAQVLAEHGVESALLDFGGNILAMGSRPDGMPWRIGVRDPETDGTLGILEVTDQSVVVSGGYERYFVGEDGERYWHILDPETGSPARSGLTQVAIISPESKRCDALSTAVFVMGLEEAADFWRSRQDFEMVLLTDDGTIYLTEGLSGRFTLGSGQEGREVQVLSAEETSAERPAIDKAGGYAVETEEVLAENQDSQIYGVLYRPVGVEGPRPTVIYPHGFGGSYRNGARYAQALAAQGYLVYCFDFRGGSDSSRSEGSNLDMSVFTEQSDLDSVIAMLQAREDVDDDNLFLLGASQGGLVSAITAADNRDAIAGVILLYPAFVLVDDAMERFDSADEVTDSMHYLFMTVGRAYFEDLFGYDVYADIQGYDGAVLILHGDRDSLVPLSYSERAVEVLPSARLEVIPGAGHGFSGANFDLVMGHILEYLTSSLNDG